MGIVPFWSPVRTGAGEILTSRSGRFVIITSTTHYTLLDKGYVVKRGDREDLLKLEAERLEVT